MNKEKLSKFLHELTSLSRKHKLYIRGCGCCGSPFIDEESEIRTEPGDGKRYTALADGDHLTWEKMPEEETISDLS